MDEHAALRSTSKGADQDGATRQQILQAAQELFLDRGYKGVAMRDIADAVHVSQAALYYHFPHGKEAVLFAVMDNMLTRWNAQLEQIQSQGGPLRGKLESVARSFLAVPFDRMMVLLRDIHTLLPESAERQALHQRLADNQHHTAVLFQAAMDAGEIHSDLPAEYLGQLFGGMLGGTIRYAAMRKTEPALPADVAATIVAVLLDGIATRA